MKRFLPSKQFVVYSVIGALGVILDFVSFAILYHVFDWNYLVANVVSTSLGITNNFVLNAFYNFRVTDELLSRFVSFYGIGIAGMGVASLLLWLQVSMLGFPPLSAKSATIVVIVILQFNLNRRFSFGSSPALGQSPDRNLSYPKQP